MDWMLMPFKRYAEFSGRSRRKEYWMFTLLNVLIVVFCYALILSSAGPGILAGDPSGMDSFGVLGIIGLIVLIVWFLAALIPGIAVTVRRLHDREMSGWWYLGFIVLSLIPLVGIIASIAMIVILALEGTDGPNKYGPDPKDPAGAAVFE
jgi:uncharacterized membrane protein YhaH (DUF805 family)